MRVAIGRRRAARRVATSVEIRRSIGLVRLRVADYDLSSKPTPSRLPFLNRDYGQLRGLAIMPKNEDNNKKTDEQYAQIDNQDSFDIFLTQANIQQIDGFLGKSFAVVFTKNSAVTDRIKTLEKSNKLVALAMTYVSENMPSGYRNFTKWLGLIKKTVDAELEKQNNRKVEEENIAAQIITINTGQHAGDGSCYIKFLNIGMGDCTLITTPKGKKIMIDCGSTAQSDMEINFPLESLKVKPDFMSSIVDCVKSVEFAGASGAIDLLLLTHSDKDHHNQLEVVLGKSKINSIGSIYYGGADGFNAYHPSSSWLKDKVGDERNDINKISLHENAKKRKNGSGPDYLKTINPPRIYRINDNEITEFAGKSEAVGQAFCKNSDPREGPITLYYEQESTSATPEFRLSILAANVSLVYLDDTDAAHVTDDADAKVDAKEAVKEKKLNGQPPNKGSLVVLIESTGKESHGILICGDATAVPEQFVLKRFRPELEKVTVLRIGHHGSPTSSSRSFVRAMTKLEHVVASTAGSKTQKYFLPKRDILKEFSGLATLAKGATEHSIWCFDINAPTPTTDDFNKITQWIFATGSNAHYARSFPPKGK